MGPQKIAAERIESKMRIIFAVLAICLLHACTAESTEDMLLQAESSISEMKKKGATNADCVDLAHTMCKEVEKEVSTDQKLINRLKDGRQCLKLGVRAVRTAIAHLRKTKTTWKHWKVAVTKSYHARVNMGGHKFSSLKKGKCGVFFRSRSYRTAKYRYRRNVKISASWRGRVREAVKVLISVKRSRARQIKVCRCSTRRTRNLLWRTLSKRSRRARQIKAHQKCKMMACILKGTSLKSKACRGSLRRLVNKKLTRATESVKRCAFTKGTFSHKVRVSAEKKSKEKKKKAKARESKAKAEKKSKEKKKKAKARERKAK